jgi:hypothetical protein
MPVKGPSPGKSGSAMPTMVSSGAVGVDPADQEVVEVGEPGGAVGQKEEILRLVDNRWRARWWPSPL